MNRREFLQMTAAVAAVGLLLGESVEARLTRLQREWEGIEYHASQDQMHFSNGRAADRH